MNLLLRLIYGIGMLAALLNLSTTFAEAQTLNTQEAKMIHFRGTEFVHRWSKNEQNEFTPRNDADLKKWQDMLTLNTHATVANGDQLAALANKVLTNYQQRGKILRTDSKARRAQQPAEHLVVAVLGNPNFLEVAFARCKLVNGIGMVAVYSHRIYGEAAGPAMSEWLKAHGTAVEQALMDWGPLPSAASLNRLPQSQ